MYFKTFLYSAVNVQLSELTEKEREARFRIELPQ